MNKGAFLYYVITLRGGGGPDTNDDIDDALRGGDQQNDNVIYEWVLSELLRLLGLKFNTKSSINTHQPQSFVNKERCPDQDKRFKRFVTLL